MERYKLLKKGFFEGLMKFEVRINEMSRKGWKVVAMSRDMNSRIVVLLERDSS